MYPNLNPIITQTPSAPPPPTPPPSTTTASSSVSSSSSLANSSIRNPVGFSSLMSQPSNQNPSHSQTQSQTTQSMYPGAPPSSQSPYPPAGQGNPLPYPTGPGGFPSIPPGPSATNQPPYPPGPNNQPNYPSSSAPYSNPYGSSSSSTAPTSNPGGYSAYSLPQASQPRPPGPGPTQGSNYPNNPYPNPNPNPSAAPPPPHGYSSYPPTSTAGGGYQNPYAQPNPYQPQPGYNPNPYQSGNPYAQPPPPQGPAGYQNPYQPSNPYSSQPGGYPPRQPPPPQSAPYSSPYGSGAAPPPPSSQGGYSGYAPYQQPGPYSTPYGQPPPGAGYPPNAYGAPPVNDRLRSIAGKYEINDTLAQRLSLLQQFELVVLCDDSGSMNTLVDGSTGTRWDELRSIVQIIIEIGTVFDSNGVDVHFLNRPPMLNVTDVRQVIESFAQRPSGVTPLTPALRRIFQSAAAKRGSDKRLLVFVATDGAPTDDHGNVDIPSLENLMRHERPVNTTYVTFLACTDDEQSVAYLSQWDRNMQNVDVVDDFKSEREEVRRMRGYNYPFTFGDYVAKALLGAIDPQIDQLDEGAMNNNNYRRF